MNRSRSHRCRAGLDQLPGVRAFAEDFCAQAAIGGSVSLRLQLVLEELFTNTVTHGHGGDSDAAVHIALHDDGPDVTVRYEDHAPPFDPLARLPDVVAERAADPDQRPVGHLGLVLVLEMSHASRYEALDGGNRLLLRLSKTD